MLSSAGTPTQKAYQPQQPSVANASRPSLERDNNNNGLQPPALLSASRITTASGVSFAPRASSLNPNPAPGSFSSDFRVLNPTQRAPSRTDTYSRDNKVPDENETVAEKNIAGLREALNREMKIKEGSENMLEALNNKKAKQSKEQRARVEAELNSSNQKIKELRQKISDAQQRTRVPQPTTPTRQRTGESLLSSNGFRSPHSVSRSGAASDLEEATESPTFALAELLQALEAERMTPDYYVSRANSLVDLFKRHPTLKYDLVWSVFGLRIQVMLLSDSREVVAAGYRVLRYAISDISSLRKIRGLNTDYLVVTWVLKATSTSVQSSPLCLLIV